MAQTQSHRSKRSPEEIENRCLHLLAHKDGQRKESVVRAWCSLTRAGVRPEVLEEALTEILIAQRALEKERNQIRRKSRQNSDWTIPAGLSRRQLCDLPNKMRGMAEVVERVDAHNVSSRFRTRCANALFERLHASPNPWPEPPAQFLWSGQDLPSTMRAYADFLERLIKRVSKLRQGPARGGESEFQTKRTAMNLIAAVYDATGQPHWTDLSNLLGTVVKNPKDWANDPNALRQFYKANQSLIESAPRRKFSSG
jgi:hypothetical protein